MGPPSPFTTALLGADVPVIMEVKRRSGDGKDLIGERTIAEIVASYEAAGAPCISVVTGRWFGGTDAMLDEVAALTDRPILKKDFITRESQLIKAKEQGASAILLTAKILPKQAFQRLIELALEHGLTPFAEVAEPSELESVIRAEECVLAANNKDIETQEREAGDLDVSRSLLEPIVRAGSPCPVSASAITEPRLGAELLEAGFKGLLVGTGLLQAESISGWVEELIEHRDAIAARAG